MPEHYATSSRHSFMMYDAFRLSDSQSICSSMNSRRRRCLFLRVLHGARDLESLLAPARISASCYAASMTSAGPWLSRSGDTQSRAAQHP